jgi:catechol 2,3-dioxygenase-like lactoylglutathione lyase family enzyme
VKLPEIKANHYVLATPDAEKTAQFFIDALGFDRVPVSDPGWRFVRKDSCMVMIGSCPDALPPSSLGDHSYFAYLVVTDVDAYHERLLAHGVEILRAPTNQPWGMREVALRTPDGHRIMLGSSELR